MKNYKLSKKEIEKALRKEAAKSAGRAANNKEKL
jgi:hypothetical protein